ncbi:MAG: hypothetical protein QW609_00345 [Candidatus Aenigmatarchaeota archaeon]
MVEAYLQDIKYVLENFLGYQIEIQDLEDVLMSYENLGLTWEWDERRRKALGYQKSGLEALFSKEEEGKEIDL